MVGTPSVGLQLLSCWISTIFVTYPASWYVRITEKSYHKLSLLCGKIIKHCQLLYQIQLLTRLLWTVAQYLRSFQYHHCCTYLIPRPHRRGTFPPPTWPGCKVMLCSDCPLRDGSQGSKWRWREDSRWVLHTLYIHCSDSFNELLGAFELLHEWSEMGCCSEMGCFGWQL